jgi:hypothetical protein
MECYHLKKKPVVDESSSTADSGIIYDMDDPEGSEGEIEDLTEIRFGDMFQLIEIKQNLKDDKEDNFRPAVRESDELSTESRMYIYMIQPMPKLTGWIKLGQTSTEAVDIFRRYHTSYGSHRTWRFLHAEIINKCLATPDGAKKLEYVLAMLVSFIYIFILFIILNRTQYGRSANYILIY